MSLFAGKENSDDPQLFDALDAMGLNKVLRDLMVGLSAKVFRTYNASITLDGLLREDLDQSLDATQKKAEYDTANKQVHGVKLPSSVVFTFGWSVSTW